MTTPIPPLLLVGCGRMGSALLAGWEAEGLSASVILDPGATEISGPHRVVADATLIPDGFAPGMVVLAVKPQMADAAIAAIAPRIGAAPVLSIMAGRTLHSLRAAFAQGGARPSGIIRAMPNTPAAIGRGISVAVAEPAVNEAGRALADRLLRAAGGVAWSEDEGQLDAVTAVSGSGPAYVFLLAELMEQAGRAQGLPADLARRLARETVAGAGALLAASSEDASALRQAVTSPNGTTQAALSVLMDAQAWPRALDRAIAAATDRSRELAV